MDILTSPFPRKAASASLLAPLLSCTMYFYLQTRPRGIRPGGVLWEAMPALLLVFGLLLGIMALFAAWRSGGPGVLGIKRAVSAVLINSAVIVCLCGSVVNPLAAGWYPFKALALSPFATRTYERGGVRFCFDPHWTVSDRPATTDVSTPLPFSREIIVRRSDGTAGVGLMFFPFDPTHDNYSLEDCARWMAFDRSGLNKQSSFKVTHDIGGMVHPGVGIRIKTPTGETTGFQWKGEADFFLLENPHLRVLVFTTGGDSSSECRTEMDSMLSSIRINGLNDFTVAKGGRAGEPHVQMIFYSPTRPFALIADQKVAVGDRVGEYKILAIAKDWISVQSSDGKTKVVAIGDSLNYEYPK